MKIKIKKSLAGILTTAYGFSLNLIKDKKMRKYTIAVAGVLAVMFGATVMANQYNQSILNTQRVGLSLFFLDGIQAPEDQLPSILETDEIMPVAKGCCFEDLDTEAGSIKVLDYSYDDPLPLCFNDCEVSDWELIVEVTGGYQPLCGVVEIIQEIGLTRMLTKLLQNLSDEGSLETQRSIALILSRTAKYEDEKIKKRVISLLKIRCEMSQDPIICETLQQLREN